MKLAQRMAKETRAQIAQKRENLGTQYSCVQTLMSSQAEKGLDRSKSGNIPSGTYWVSLFDVEIVWW